MEGARPTPKPRPLKLEAHILAYLGDFMSVFEESVKRLATTSLEKGGSPNTGLNNLKHAEQSQAGQSNTASVRSPS
jgi:hypothetical protein